ncbi:hypothetical protein JAO76_17175 [Pontibacter sp. BT310]|uniref:DUF4890 domain-containing protein n=1 Tax=Pontibacter populi TaxID=890055 RepID=A0ABS6XFN2_9BACT|nr:MULTISPECIES: hypothetical protein [Pontibacter]MBJ6119942.1 hypothetical protein [Pontibacter sp. BT310]MBR0572371.1 hypothetical protein [Microvirga sp. STS03]MBW3366795.1 hypothetical protein [Pontibacter populi]
MKTNSILKKVFVLGLGVFLSVGAMAQEQQQGTPKKQMTPAERQEKMLENYKKNLNLTDAQTKKLKAIQEDRVKDMQAIRNDQNLTRDAKREKMKALHASQQQEITTILNAEQKQKFAEMQAKKEARKSEMNGKRGEHHKGNKMKQHKMQRSS